MKPQKEQRIHNNQEYGGCKNKSRTGDMKVQVVQPGRYYGVDAGGHAGQQQERMQYDGVGKQLVGDPIADQRRNNKFDRNQIQDAAVVLLHSGKTEYTKDSR